MKQNHEVSKSIDRLILSMATMLFVTLKLCGVIDWHWVWVFSPIWIPILFLTLLGIFSVVFSGDDDDDNDDDEMKLDDDIAGP